MPSSPPGKAAAPPERRSTFQSHISFDSLRRRGTGVSSASSSSKKEKGPFQEHFSCYEGLSWEALKGYLERKWPHIRLNLTERKELDHWIFVVPERLTQEDHRNIAGLRDSNQGRRSRQVTPE